VTSALSGVKRVDILVNNAGIAHIGTAATTSDEDLDRLYNVNVKGLHHCTHSVLAGMVEQGGGVILNMCSIAAMMGLGASSLGKSAFGQIVSLRPGNPTASIGETWTTASDLGSSPLGAVGMKTNWTVDNVARGIADIRFAGTLASKSEAGGLLKITDLTYGGKAAWDTERGRLKRMDSKMTMS
jgi:NAD(P)-dependent dehydrogenase (short-subunit alcohol dehydrogenase family)